MSKQWKFWLRIAVGSILLGSMLALAQVCLVIHTELDDYTVLGVLRLAVILTAVCFASALALVVLSWVSSKFFRWFFRWKVLKWCLFSFIVFLLLIPLFYVEENWRGHRAWENCKHELEAKGEKLDFAAFIPPGVPDEQNFAFAPVVKTSWNWLLDTNGQKLPQENRNVVRRLELGMFRTNQMLQPPAPTNDWRLGGAVDLVAWQNYYRTMFVTNRYSTEMAMPLIPGYNVAVSEKVLLTTNALDTNEVIEVVSLATDEFPVAHQQQTPAADVLLALSKFDPVLDELRVASARPQSRFPLNYSDVSAFGLLLPHYSNLKDCVQVLRLRACAELALGSNQLALADIQLALRLTDSIRGETGIFPFESRLEMLNQMMQPIWEGISQASWTDEQLQRLDSSISALKLFDDFAFGLRSELAQTIRSIEFMRMERTKNSITCMCGDTMWWPTLLYRLAPDGWFYLNEKTVSHVFISALPSEEEIRQQVVSKAASQRYRLAEALERKWSLVPQNFALSFIPPLDRFASPCARTQASLDLARVAIALERYRLAEGTYPDTLSALTPRFFEKIPHDVINGQPLHYRRTVDGKYLLYSIGLDKNDDGGVVFKTESGRLDQKRGDWVWMMPAESN